MAINPPSSSSPILPPPATTTTATTTMSLTYYPYPASNSHRLQIFSAFHLTKHGSSSSSSKAPPLPPPAAFALATREIIAISDTNAAELDKFLAFKEEESGRGERSWRNGALVRRKRRRKRRRDSDSDPDPDSEKAADPLFLTTKQVFVSSMRRSKDGIQETR